MRDARLRSANLPQARPRYHRAVFGLGEGHDSWDFNEHQLVCIWVLTVEDGLPRSIGTGGVLPFESEEINSKKIAIRFGFLRLPTAILKELISGLSTAYAPLILC